LHSSRVTSCSRTGCQLRQLQQHTCSIDAPAARRCRPSRPRWSLAHGFASKLRGARRLPSGTIHVPIVASSQGGVHESLPLLYKKLAGLWQSQGDGRVGSTEGLQAQWMADASTSLQRGQFCLIKRLIGRGTLRPAAGGFAPALAATDAGGCVRIHGPHACCPLRSGATSTCERGDRGPTADALSYSVIRSPPPPLQAAGSILITYKVRKRGTSGEGDGHVWTQ
jgi:hypothetical protein